MINSVSYKRGVLSGSLSRLPLNTLLEIESNSKGRRRFFLLSKSVYEESLDVDEALPPSNTNFQHRYVRQHGLVVGSFLDVVSNRCAFDGLSVSYVQEEEPGSPPFTCPTESPTGGILLFFSAGSFLAIPASPPDSPLLVKD